LILEGLAHCTPRNTEEQALAGSLRFSPDIRLACQTRVTDDVKLRRLVLDAEDVELTSQLGAAAGTPSAVGQEKCMTVLFADIRGFTAFAEVLPPYDVVHVLNRYFDLMGDVIRRHGGEIDNYMGDGLMELFGMEDSAAATLEAVKAGLEMFEAVERLKSCLLPLYGRAFEISIGIHAGDVVVGALGAPGTRRVTAIGDAVNIASRIESATRAVGARFLISAVTYARVSEHIEVGRRVRVPLPGKSVDYDLCEIVGLREANDTRAGQPEPCSF
jgi:adenylate cyclase